MFSSCSSWPFAVNTSGSIGRSTILHVVGRRDGSDSYVGQSSRDLEQGMIGDDKDFFGEGQREVEGHLSLRDNHTSTAKVWFRAAMQAVVGNLSAAEGDFFEHPRSQQNTQRHADFLLSHWEIMGDFDLKITTTETFFLPVKSTAES